MFEISRILNAPPDLVFKVWTEPKHIMKWWGPGGVTSPHCEVDLREGGKFKLCMKSPDGSEFWNKGLYKEIIADEKIVSTMVLCDEAGVTKKPTEFGLGADFPEENLDTVTFAAHKKTKTKLTLNRDVSVAVAKRYMMNKGWEQSLDKLEKHLKTLKKSRN